MDQSRRAHGRRIGPVGTGFRILLGIALVYLALAEEGTFVEWEVEPVEVFLGGVVFPLLMVGVGLLAGAVFRKPVRILGVAGVLVNAALIFVLLVNHATHDAALFFYGISFPVAAWRGLPGCELTVISNLILGRNDEIGCPMLAPVDALESGYVVPGRPVTALDVVLETGVCLALIIAVGWFA